ncbi:MAG TPA: fibronectin type III domain-containing protein, partial [Smithella sp.]|nr:fibronectin type III domain-containing protein [Smithella sp.]
MKKSLRYFVLLCLMTLAITACAPKEEDKPEPVKPKIEGTQLIANAGYKEVTLDWTMNADAETYNVYYIADTAGVYSSTNKPSASTLLAGTKITGLISATLTITNLTNGTEYWFAVTAVNQNGESDLSEIVSATPSDPAPPKAPSNVRANAGNTQITVTWDEVVGADQYTLYYSYMDSLLNIDNDQIDDAG